MSAWTCQVVRQVRRARSLCNSYPALGNDAFCCRKCHSSVVPWALAATHDVASQPEYHEPSLHMGYHVLGKRSAPTFFLLITVVAFLHYPLLCRDTHKYISTSCAHCHHSMFCFQHHPQQLKMLSRSPSLRPSNYMTSHDVGFCLRRVYSRGGGEAT